MRTSNPTLSNKMFDKARAKAPAQAGTMTIHGTINKTMLLFLILLLPAFLTWNYFFSFGSLEAGQAAVMPWTIGGAIGGFVLAIIMVFKFQWSPYLAPIYAGLEGLFLGGISAIFEAQYSGIAVQAVSLTMATFFSLLLIYRAGWIKVTRKFRLGVMAATGGIALVYIISFMMNMFGGTMPYIHDSGFIGIGFSLFVIVIAALNLVLDFDFIERGAQQQAPKYMEWFAAFGLMLTLIWLYIEILRLLAKIRR
jgi:uncharacterized YccA/Bax inhibitor family protein